MVIRTCTVYWTVGLGPDHACPCARGTTPQRARPFVPFHNVDAGGRFQLVTGSSPAGSDESSSPRAARLLLPVKIGIAEGRPVWFCAVRVELEFELWNPFVAQFGRGTFSPAYKYKGHDRLRSFYPIESINLHFFYFSPNPSFSNLVLFFARLYGVQRRLEWPKTTPNFRAPTGSLPSLRF